MRGIKNPRCRKCGRAIIKFLDRKCLQKETVMLKEQFEHTRPCGYYKRRK